MNDIPGAIERSLEQSLERLRPRQRRAVPAAQSARRRRSATGRCFRPSRCCGRAASPTPSTGCKEQGLFHASGMTAAGETKAILEVIESGRFDCAQVYYNAINPSAGWSRAAPELAGAGFLRDHGGVLPREHGHAQHPGLRRRPARQAGAAGAARRAHRRAPTSTTRCAAPPPCAPRSATPYGSPAQIALRFVLGNHDCPAASSASATCATSTRR